MKRAQLTKNKAALGGLVLAGFFANSLNMHAYAQDNAPEEITIKPVIGFTNLSQAINTMLAAALFFGALACLAYLVFGAFKYLTSRDDPSQVEMARKTMLNAVVGIILLGLIVVLFQIVVAVIPGLDQWFGAR